MFAAIASSWLNTGTTTLSRISVADLIYPVVGRRSLLVDAHVSAGLSIAPRAARSASTSIRTRPSKSIVGSQPSRSRALVGIADEVVELGLAAPQRLVDPHVLAPVEADVLERALDEVLRPSA